MTLIKVLLRTLVFAAGLNLCAIGAASAVPSPQEAALIESLISEVAATQNMVFIRNGSEHNAADAAGHLRDKYAYFNKEIVTADDFIRLCGTESEMTHLAYKVRMPDGTVMLSALMLKQALAHLRAAK